jgi:hypothetical protein
MNGICPNSPAFVVMALVGDVDIDNKERKRRAREQLRDYI